MTTIIDNAKSAEQTSMIIRVVFDGAPHAGKTTAIRALGDALGGSVITPAEQDGRTLWFDWMAYSAGHMHGRPMRVELVTVPGQADLSDRRDHLLEWGDAVVFIADTSRASFAASVAQFAALRREIGGKADTPVVVIANKRDLLDVVPLEDVRTQLGLDDHTMLVEGIATSGGGISDAFVHAVRSVLSNSVNRIDSTTADELLADMQAALAPQVGAPLFTLKSEPVEQPMAAPLPDPAPASSPEVHAVSPVDPESAPADEAALDTGPDLTPDTVVEPAGPEPVPAPVGVRQLNPNAMRDGETMVISTEQWRVLVAVADQTLGRGDDDDGQAATIAELESWGLIVTEPAAPVALSPSPTASPQAAEPVTVDPQHKALLEAVHARARGIQF